jgi:LuxR family maltose regulon positive regulatory protein
MKEMNTAKAKSLFPIWLLRSKVSPTRQRVDLLDRPSHTMRLHQSLDAKLSLVTAPAGYGKSTLLSNWRELLLEEGHKVCWLSLGRQDNDPMQLLTYIAFSLVTGGVPFENDQLGLEFQLADLSERDFLSLIIHFIAESKHRVVLILDDFENLGPEVIQRVIGPFLEYAPDNLHLSIATRHDSHLKISSLEAKGQAVRFGATQLRFTPIELNDFLAKEHDSQTISHLFRATEGWPVAIQMIRSAIAMEADVDRILGDLTGDATHIASYLSEEVINSLDADLQDFLMDISLVDRVDCEFADYLREQLDSQARFTQARTLDALVLPVDSVDATFRLHPLFREHLYERLSITRPERLRVLHARAAEWFGGRGDLVEAVRNWVLAGEANRGIDTLARAGGVLLWFIEGLTRLRAIMQLFDEETITGDWRLAMIRCLLNVKDGKVSQARQLYDDTTARSEVSVHDFTVAGETLSIHEFVIMEIVISIYEGKLISDAVSKEIEARVASLEPNEHAVRSNLLTFLCVSNLQSGRFGEARKFGELARPSFLAAGSQYGAAYIDFHLGDISFAEGNGAEAARYYKRGLDVAKKHFNDDHGMKLVANILMSELDYELNDPQGSGVSRAVPRQLEKNEAWFDIYAAGYVTSAHHEFDELGIEAALVTVDRAVKYAELNQLFRLTKLLACLRIELLLRAGLTSDARTVQRQSGIDIEDYKSQSENQIAWRERDAAVQAITRLLIREGQYQQALDVLRYFSRRARADGHVRARMKYKILLAIAHGKTGDIARQKEHLRGALELFAHSRFIRSFLNEKEELAGMLNDFLEQQDKEDSDDILLESARLILKQYGGREEDADSQPLLSKREFEVLQELVHGFSNKVIARKIDVSESTVRFHLRNIFAKLKVGSRLQAVSVARQMNLI